MSKTNIRIDGFYLARESNQFFKTSINNHQTWIEEEDITEFVENKVTKQYKNLVDKYGIKYNVNFLTSKSGG